jgi:hypothetical protein
MLVKFAPDVPLLLIDNKPGLRQRYEKPCPKDCVDDRFLLILSTSTHIKILKILQHTNFFHFIYNSNLDNKQPLDPEVVTVFDRWSLFKGLLYNKRNLRPQNGSLIARWSLPCVLPYLHVIIKSVLKCLIKKSNLQVFYTRILFNANPYPDNSPSISNYLIRSVYSRNFTKPGYFKTLHDVAGVSAHPQLSRIRSQFHFLKRLFLKA